MLAKPTCYINAISQQPTTLVLSRVSIQKAYNPNFLDRTKTYNIDITYIMLLKNIRRGKTRASAYYFLPIFSLSSRIVFLSYQSAFVVAIHILHKLYPLQFFFIPWIRQLYCVADHF
ncbi:hypothetical protein L218DRAFT_751785 [Marasmius fiardii PR-910]|nr:hypothetical protein L218DRAFT_751785 [Marasmius fiardii PR-910]